MGIWVLFWHRVEMNTRGITFAGVIASFVCCIIFYLTSY